MKHIFTVIGTRPEAIKLAPLVHAIRRRDDLCVTVCLSGQHRALVAQMLEWLDLPVDLELDVAAPSLACLAAAMLEQGQRSLRQHAPDLVLVQGDTTTALATALAAFYERIPVAHVEAGLRSGSREAPWPEELHRVLLARLATLHFAPTTANAEQLRAEGVDGVVHITGNTVVDCLLDTVRRIDGDASLRATLATGLRAAGYDPGAGRRFVVVTSHRREHFGTTLQAICRGLLDLARSRRELDLVWPLHANPQVREPVRAALADEPNIKLLPALDYPSFIYLLRACYLVLTDSGGIQEEAPSLDKPVLVMRAVSERQEVLDAGAARLIGTGAGTIVTATGELLDSALEYRAMAVAPNPYGDGRAAERIATLLAQALRD